jgi:hypothetical protein
VSDVSSTDWALTGGAVSIGDVESTVIINGSDSAQADVL